MDSHENVILPGGTIGILGGGQLGKMLVQSAHQLGYHTVVWAAEFDSPAAEMATYSFIAPFDDEETFVGVCDLADVITTEWENIPVWLLEKFEASGKLVRPSSKVLAIAQSRNAEKEFAKSVDANPVPWCFFKAGESLANKATLANYMPLILKTDRLGYDGRGQVWINSPSSLINLPETVEVDSVLEQVINFTSEISILVARNARGEIEISRPVLNCYENGILSETNWCQGLIPEAVENQARIVADKMAVALDLIGILVIEFFITRDGELFFNEMAPRPHNSFHGSIEAAYTSQFEQHIRAICNLPLGSLKFHTGFTMNNLLGTSVDELVQMMSSASALGSRVKFHYYGKAEARAGRKMGHTIKLLTSKP